MPNQNKIKTTGRKLITTKTVFTITLLVAVLTILSIWLFGLRQHRTIFQNSMLSTTTLSLAFFLFLTIGLYNGIKLKDNLGKLTDRIKIEKIPDLSGGFEFPSWFPDIGEGFGEIILGILAWILFSIVLLILIWFFSAILWAMVLVFAAMLYWIFFRAMRLVFINSNKCNGKLVTSMGYAIIYTVLYNFWIYGIILATHFLV